MTDIPPSRNPLQRIIQEADNQLQDIEPSPFSPSAFSVLKEKISEYIVQLVSESIKISKRHQADTVSATHVERASEYLVSSTSRRFFRHLGTVGGILLGASLSNILSITVSGQYSAAGILVSAGLGIIGAFMIALHIAKD
jgi:histone H3/H4